MRRSLLPPFVSARSARYNGVARYSQQRQLEDLHKLKQPNELPKAGRRREWKDESTWPMILGSGVLAVAAIGAIAYEANRYWSLNPRAKRILDKDQFHPFTLTAKEPVTPSCSIFTLLPTKNTKSVGDPYERLWLSPVWSVQAKQPQLQIARSYTPLPPTRPYVSTDPEACALRFLIREETNGEMSGYLHRLGVGAVVELRGPTLECQIPKDLDEIVFFAGGTGIAPALQVANYLARLPPGSGKTPRMKLIWASRLREDCAGGVNDSVQKSTQTGSWSSMLGAFTGAKPEPESQTASPIVQELERLKKLYTGRLEVDYYVDEESNFVTAAAVRHHLSDAPNADSAGTSSKAVMISGPDGFVKHLAGAKVWMQGQEQQGRLGGLLQDAVQPHWTVIKL